MEATVGLFLIFALAATTMGQMQPMGQMGPMPMQPPHPMQMQMQMQPPPPPYNMYGPVNPYAASSQNPMMYQQVPHPPQQMVPPPPGPGQYPAGTSVSFSTSPMLPMMAAAAMPYPAYGAPPPMMMPPPYQTYSGSGPNGDPFTSTAGSGIFNARALTQFFGLKKKR